MAKNNGAVPSVPEAIHGAVPPSASPVNGTIGGIHPHTGTHFHYLSAPVPSAPVPYDPDKRFASTNHPADDTNGAESHPLLTRADWAEAILLDLMPLIGQLGTKYVHSQHYAPFQEAMKFLSAVHGIEHTGSVEYAEKAKAVRALRDRILAGEEVTLVTTHLVINAAPAESAEMPEAEA